MNIQVKKVCFIVLHCHADDSKAKEELKNAVATLKRLAYWTVEKVSVIES